MAVQSIVSDRARLATGGGSICTWIGSAGGGYAVETWLASAIVDAPRPPTAVRTPSGETRASYDRAVKAAAHVSRNTSSVSGDVWYSGSASTIGLNAARASDAVAK